LKRSVAFIRFNASIVSSGLPFSFRSRATTAHKFFAWCGSDATPLATPTKSTNNNVLVPVVVGPLIERVRIPVRDQLAYAHEAVGALNPARDQPTHDATISKVAAPSVGISPATPPTTPAADTPNNAQLAPAPISSGHNLVEFSAPFT